MRIALIQTEKFLCKINFAGIFLFVSLLCLIAVPAIAILTLQTVAFLSKKSPCGRRSVLAARAAHSTVSVDFPETTLYGIPRLRNTDKYR